MLFFGRAWPYSQGWRTFIGPPALLCLYCDKPIHPHDSGVVMSALGPEGEYSCAYHRHCLFETLGIEGPDAPGVTPKMQQKGLEWALIDGQWRPVCSTCKGNCGQCGLTDLVGNVPPMPALIKSS